MQNKQLNSRPNARTQRGFTLLELEIAIAIVAIVASAAVPNLLTGRITRNEDSTISAADNVVLAQDAHRRNTGSYAEALEELETAGLIDNELGSGQKSGYLFSLSSSDPFMWTMTANPANPQSTGRRHFYVDETGVIRQNPDETADSDDPPIRSVEAVETRTFQDDLDQLANTAIAALDGLVPEEAVAGALALLLNTPGFEATVLAELDDNGDNVLTFDEVLAVDILAAARAVRLALEASLGPPGAFVGPDQDITNLTQNYRSSLQQDLTLGIANEELPTPPVTLASLAGTMAPVVFLGGTAVPAMGPGGAIVLVLILGPTLTMWLLFRRRVGERNSIV